MTTNASSAHAHARGPAPALAGHAGGAGLQRGEAARHRDQHRGGGARGPREEGGGAEGGRGPQPPQVGRPLGGDGLLWNSSGKPLSRNGLLHNPSGRPSSRKSLPALEPLGRSLPAETACSGTPREKPASRNGLLWNLLGMAFLRSGPALQPLGPCFAVAVFGAAGLGKLLYDIAVHNREPLIACTAKGGGADGSDPSHRL